MTLEERVKATFGEMQFTIAAALVELDKAKARIEELEKENAELKNRLPGE